jgi:hypothetical protein
MFLVITKVVMVPGKGKDIPDRQTAELLALDRFLHPEPVGVGIAGIGASGFLDKMAAGIVESAAAGAAVQAQRLPLLFFKVHVRFESLVVGVLAHRTPNKKAIMLIAFSYNGLAGLRLLPLMFSLVQ